jgi:hypothetical protein
MTTMSTPTTTDLSSPRHARGWIFRTFGPVPRAEILAAWDEACEQGDHFAPFRGTAVDRIVLGVALGECTFCPVHDMLNCEHP